MNKGLLSKLLPHIIAIVIFLIVSVLFCKPVLEGNVLNQHDVIGWKGMAQNALEYKKTHGHFPLWNPNLFSGMPNYQIAMGGKELLPDLLTIFTLGLPKPINFFFFACLCFYILSIALKARPVVGIFASLAYAFSTYNAVIIAAGHETQMWATALAPLILAGLIFTFQKKYWLGLSLVTYGTYQQLGVNHLQISYYFFLIAAIISLSFLIVWIKNKEWKHTAISIGVVLVAAITGLAANALSMLVTSEYSKYTMRGGKEVSIEGDNVKQVKTSGLDTSYAFIYSIRKAETSTLLMPNSFGGGSKAVIGETSHVVEKLASRGINEGNAVQIANSLPKYWGGLPYTAGPAYLGVFICILGLLGFVFVKQPLRWALLAATLFGIFMSWGKNFAGFNTFLFEHMPLFNKFRAPSMAQFIPQVCVCIMAVLALQQLLFDEKSREFLNVNFKKILYATGGLFALLAILYLAIDYTSPIDQQILANRWDNSGSDEIGRLIVSGLKADRSAMFGGQILRAFGFTLLILGALYLYMRNVIKPLVVGIVLIVISTLELTITSREYLSDEDYIAPDEYISNNFVPTTIDQQLLQEKDPDFRVFNLAGDTYNESRTSYFHKSVGGYHPAKLRIYQDVIEKYLSEQPDSNVLNMLNTKYIIASNPQTRQPMLFPNPGAYGPCWLVKNVKLVKGPVEEIKALGNTGLKDTAIVQKEFSQLITQPQFDSASSIRLTKFDNDTLEYEANCTAPQFAVFSEIYYPKGWNAYIDGKKTDYCRTNYILRGISVPAGKHQIKFIFEPETYKKGVNIAFAASFFVGLFFFGGLFMAWWESRKKLKDEKSS
jgi:hypothetical protein